MINRLFRRPTAAPTPGFGKYLADCMDTPGQPAGSQTYDMEKTNIYCPYCGEQRVAREVDAWDIERGTMHQCELCQKVFYMDEKAASDD